MSQHFDLDKVVIPSRTIGIKGETLEVRPLSPRKAFELQEAFTAFQLNGATPETESRLNSKLEEVIPGITKHDILSLEMPKFVALVEFIVGKKNSSQQNPSPTS